jgi:hypothetical protein
VPVQPGNSGSALVDKLKEANAKERKFEDVVKPAESRQVGILVLVY